MEKQKKPIVLEGKLEDVPGKLVFDSDGFYRGFINTNNTRMGGIMPGPDGKVAGVLLADGTLQNPDGTRSKYTNPVQYLLETVKPIKEKQYHISSLVGKK